MASHVIADRVADTSTTTGTSDFTVSGSAPTGYRSIGAVCSTGDTFYYCISHQSASEWEVGIGTYSGSNIFVRSSVMASSNSNSAVNFSAGTKDVFVTLAAGGAARSTRVVTGAGDVTVAVTDDIIVVNKASGAATAVNLPSSPVTGQSYVIKDGKGDAATNNITVTPASGNIDGSATFVMDRNYQSCVVVYTGSEWSQISVAPTRASLGLSTSDSPQFTAVNIGDAADTTLSRLSSGVLGVEGAALLMVGVNEWFIPAAAFAPRTTNGCATLATLETTTNKVNIPYLAFDATTQEFAQAIIPRMPKAWNEGTLTAIAVWTHPSTTTNFGVVWGVSGLALSDDDAADTAFGTAQTATDTGGTTSDVYHSPATSAITIGNSPAEGDTVILQVSRNPSDGSDTMAVDAYFIGLLIRVTTNAANDA